MLSPVVAAAILELLVPVMSCSILTMAIGQLNPENISVAVGILCITCLEVEINLFEVSLEAAILTFHFRFCRSASQPVPFDS